VIAKALTLVYILGVCFYIIVNLYRFLSAYEVKLLLNAIFAALSVYIFWRGSKFGEIVLKRMLKHKFYVVKSLFTLSFLFTAVVLSVLGIFFFLLIGWLFPIFFFPSLEKYLFLLILPPFMISFPLLLYPIAALRGAPIFLFSAERKIGMREALRLSWRVRDKLVFYGTIQTLLSSLLESLAERVEKISKALSHIISRFGSALIEWTFVIYIAEKIPLPKAFAKAYGIWKRTPFESFYGENIALLVFFLLLFLSAIILLIFVYFVNPFSLCPPRTSCYMISQITMAVITLFFIGFVPVTGFILFKPAFYITMLRLIKQGKIKLGKSIIPAKIEEIVRPYFKELAEMEEKAEKTSLSILVRILDSKVYRVMLVFSLFLSFLSLLIGFLGIK